MDDQRRRGLLLRQTERRIRLLERVAACFVDARNPERVEHTLAEMLAQRIYGLALSYEDLNDHEELRRYSLLGCWPGNGNRTNCWPARAG